MRPSAVAAGLLALLVTAPVAARAAPARYVLDPAHLSITFSAGHLGLAAVQGMFLKAQGFFVFDEAVPALLALEVEVAADSVFTNHAGRDGHLRQPDFLAAADHPTIRFVMSGATATGPRTGLVQGDLTLRGVTQPIVLGVTWNNSGPSPIDQSYRLGASATATIERSRWGMDYALAQGWVPDAVDLRIETEAVRE